MNKIVYLMCALFVVSIIGFVSSATDTVPVSDTFKINQIVNYAKPCFNNGSYCSSSTICNYTITDPNNNIIVDNKPATNKVSVYNYSIVPRTIGIYKTDMICNDNGLTGSETFYFEATPSGFNESIGFFAILILVSAGLIVLGFSIKEGWLVVFGGMILIITGLYSLNEGIAGVRNMVTTWALGITFIGVGAYLSIVSIIEMMTEEDIALN